MAITPVVVDPAVVATALTSTLMPVEPVEPSPMVRLISPVVAVWSAVWAGRLGLLGGVSAVHGEGDADDEAGAGAAQPEHGGGDFVGPAEPADGLVGQRFGGVE